jgi:hypothetical protein
VQDCTYKQKKIVIKIRRIEGLVIRTPSGPLVNNPHMQETANEIINIVEPAAVLTGECGTTMSPFWK